MFNLAVGILSTVLAGPISQQDPSQEIQSTLIVSTKITATEIHSLHKAKTKAELEALAKGRYVSYPSPVTAIIEEDDPLGIDFLKETVAVMAEIQSSGVKPGEYKNLGSYSPSVKKFLTEAVTNPAYGLGKFSDIDKVQTQLYPTTVFHLESKGHRVGATYGKSTIPNLKEEDLPMMSPYVPSPDDPPRPTTVISGNLCFSAGFWTPDSTRRELIDAYMSTRAMERENLLLQRRDLAESWDPSAKEMRDLVGKSFNDLPKDVQSKLRQSAKYLGEFKSDEELDLFLSGAKLTKSSSYMTMNIAYLVEDKKMENGKRRSGLTFPVMR